MKKLFLYGALLSLVSSGNTHAALEQYSVNGVKLVLDTEHCLLKANETILPIGMTADCFFIRDKKSNKIDSQLYQNTGSRVLLVVGTPLVKESLVKASSRQDCGNQIRAVIINKSNEVSLSSKILPDSTVCAGAGVDQKLFDQLAD